MVVVNDNGIIISSNLPSLLCMIDPNFVVFDDGRELMKSVVSAVDYVKFTT